MSIETNKQILQDFFKLVIAGKIDDAYDKYVDDEFTHHNAYYKSDRQSLLQGMKDNHKKMPAKIFTIKQIVAEKDTVITFSHIQFDTKDQGFGVMHIAKFKNGKIIEMWDMAQQIPRESPNKKGMF